MLFFVAVTFLTFSFFMFFLEESDSQIIPLWQGLAYLEWVLNKSLSALIQRGLIALTNDQRVYAGQQLYTPNLIPNDQQLYASVKCICHFSGQQLTIALQFLLSSLNVKVKKFVQKWANSKSKDSPMFLKN